MSSECAGSFPAVWREVLSDHFCGDDPILPVVKEILPSKATHLANPVSFLLPPLLPWDPCAAYRCHFSCPLCPPDSQAVLNPDTWTLGQHGAHLYSPRFVHGVNSPVLLISRVYKCQNSHTFPAHSPSILTLLPPDASIPFRLSHRSGYTSNLESFVQQHIDSTLSTRRTCHILADNRQRFYQQRYKLYHSVNHSADTLSCPTFEQWQQMFGTSHFNTSHAVLIASYVHRFEQDANRLHTHMAHLTMDQYAPYLSCDHTFKTAGMLSPLYVALKSQNLHTCMYGDCGYSVQLSTMQDLPSARSVHSIILIAPCMSLTQRHFLYTSAVNIGMHRPEANKWVTQRCALFCVLNSHGQVLTWKLTTSVKFEHCQDVLTALHQRLQQQHKHVQQFIVDICCGWRRKLQSVFGSNLKVLLDLFHAIQRVLIKIPKRHKLRPLCTEDFRLVFRDPADKGLTRTMATPAPGKHCTNVSPLDIACNALCSLHLDVLERQLDEFLQRWQDQQHDGINILSSLALKEIANLRVHIQRGCLSGKYVVSG